MLYNELAQHLQDLGYTLNPPASDAELQAAETALGHPLPAEIQALWRTFNGAMKRTDSETEFDIEDDELRDMLTAHLPEGQMQFYEILFGTQDIIERSAEILSQQAEAIAALNRETPQLLPIFTGHFDELIAYDLHPEHAGRILLLDSGDYEPCAAIADSIEDWLNDMWGNENSAAASLVQDIGADLGIFDEQGEFALASPQPQSLEDCLETEIGEITGSWELGSGIRIQLIDDELAENWFAATDGLRSRRITSLQGETYTAELCIALPYSWNTQDLSQPENQWPIMWLDMLTTLPEESLPALAYGQLITAPDGTDAFPSTPFAGLTLLPPFEQDSGPNFFISENGEPCRLLALTPLYPAEIDLLQQQGADALIQHFEQHSITLPADPNRPSAA